MKLKINKACDLNSISVLPPHSRRNGAPHSGPGTSVFGGAAMQLRSQPSQQSFSQGISSQQYGMTTQFSQTSLDEGVTNDQRFCSQERDYPAKRMSCPPPASYSREDSQVPMTRSSNSLMRKWSSNGGKDHKCQTGDEHEHRITAIETSLSRIGMILDSVQSDVMQVNRATKELSLEIEGLRQKSTSHDDSLHLLNRGQEDIRATLEGGFKSVADQLNQHTVQDKLLEILPIVQNISAQIESSQQKLKDELCQSLVGKAGKLQQSIEFTEVIAKQLTESTHVIAKMTTCFRTSEQSNVHPPRHPVEDTGLDSSTQMLLLKRALNLVKSEKKDLLNEGSHKEKKHRKASPVNQYEKRKVLVDSEKEDDGEFSMWSLEKEGSAYSNMSISETKLMKEAKEETERILRKARRRKRRQSKMIFID